MIDIHVHYFPQEVFKAIWKFFESKSKGLWNINYKLSGDELVQQLKSYGVERMTTLVYAHKKGIADFLNDYIFEEASKHKELIPFGTLFVGDGQCEKRSRKIFEDYAFYGIKLHPFVSKEQIDDKNFMPVYEMMQEKEKILVCHPGSGPTYKETDGADRLRNILQEFPNLKVVVAHCGAFEYGDYHSLADSYKHVYFDTAMNCVDTCVFENNCPGTEFFEKYSDRILFGSDFPNIPYDYEEQRDALLAKGLGVEIEEKIFEGNARKLLGF